MNQNRQNNRCVTPVGPVFGGRPGTRPAGSNCNSSGIILTGGCTTVGGVIGTANNCNNSCGAVAANECNNPCGAVVVNECNNPCGAVVVNECNNPCGAVVVNGCNNSCGAVVVNGCNNSCGAVVVNECNNPCGVVGVANNAVTGGIIIGQNGSACNPETKLNDLSIAMAYVPWQSYCNLYSIPQALRNGTLFRELDLEFAGRRCN